MCDSSSISMLPYRMVVPGGAGRMLDSHFGEVMSRRTSWSCGRHGAVVEDCVRVIWVGITGKN